MIKGYRFEEVEFPRPSGHRTVLVKDIVDGRQTNAEAQGLAYVFEVLFVWRAAPCSFLCARVCAGPRRRLGRIELGLIEPG